MPALKKLINATVGRFKSEGDTLPPITPADLAQLTDLSDAEKDIVVKTRAFTMTGIERVAALINAVRYVLTNKIPGDFAECGVWRGGSMMTVALMLKAYADTSRTLYLYDTFTGMSEPTEVDRRHDGFSAAVQLEDEVRKKGSWCYASLEDVRANMFSTEYPQSQIRFVQGKVEDTIPGTLPSHLALLRLDTDWYESTKHELTHMFPLLDEKGVLIIDDYGYWQGARKAVDEYFLEKKRSVFLHRIDCTGRILVGKGLPA